MIDSVSVFFIQLFWRSFDEINSFLPFHFDKILPLYYRNKPLFHHFILSKFPSGEI